MSGVTAVLPSLESLKKVEQVDVISHLGMRTVRCQLTGALIRDSFAAVPVKSAKKAGKVTWRGVFLDYETVMTYLNELLAANQITEDVFKECATAVAQHLDFVPTLASGIRYTELAPLGFKSLVDWRSSYANASYTTAPSAFFAIPAEKSKTAPKEPKEKRYNGFEAVANKTGISIEGRPIAFTTNNVASLVAPWGDEEEAKSKSFSFLVSMDGAKPPKKVIVARVPTPTHQAKVLGHPSAKDGTEVYVLEAVSKPKKIKKEPEADALAPKKSIIKKRSPNKEAIAAAFDEATGGTKTIAKKRKVTATA